MERDARADELIALEQRFWQSMVNGETEVAVGLLAEPALIVSDQGALRFDHATYRRMADGGGRVLRSFSLTEMQATFPTPEVALLSYRVDQEFGPRGGGGGSRQRAVDSSVWVRQDGAWRCAMHTETPVAPAEPTA